MQAPVGISGLARTRRCAEAGGEVGVNLGPGEALLLLSGALVTRAPMSGAIRMPEGFTLSQEYAGAAALPASASNRDTYKTTVSIL